MLAEPIQQQIQWLEAEYQVLLEKLAALPFPIGNRYYQPWSVRNEDAEETESKRRTRSQAGLWTRRDARRRAAALAAGAARSAAAGAVGGAAAAGEAAAGGVDELLDWALAPQLAAAVTDDAPAEQGDDVAEEEYWNDSSVF